MSGAARAAVHPDAAAAMLADGGEIAFLDVRERVRHGAGHPLLAFNLPLARLELDVGALVPRRATRIVLVDGGDGRAALAARRLAGLGYEAAAVLEGGAPGWAAAGHALFPELEVPVKGFGGFAERHGRPRFVEPTDLARALDAGEDWIVLDARPRAEYRAGNIPGSIDAPGADALRSFDELVPDPSTKVVVNCMTRTRGILGALSLRAAGVPNEVYALRNGTRAWLLEGLDLEHGADRRAPAPGPAARAGAIARAAHLAERAGIPRIDRATLQAWRADETRTTYVFDVRRREEYGAGHVPGARSAPEGVLVMSPEGFFATLGARIVLADDDGVRATVTALWLAQMGWGEAAVLEGGLDGPLATGDDADGTAPPPPAADPIAPADLHALAGRVRVVDVGCSDDYIAAHVPGAVWCPRADLPGALDEVGAVDDLLVLTSTDGRVARLAAADLAGASRAARVLDGGTGAWRAAGLATESGAERLLRPRDDHWLAASERPGEVRRNVVDYIEWETGLLDDIERTGPVPFRNLLWSGGPGAAGP